VGVFSEHSVVESVWCNVPISECKYCKSVC